MSNSATPSKTATPLVEFTHNYLHHLHRALANCSIPNFYPSNIDSWDGDDLEDLFDMFERTMQLIWELQDASAELHYVLRRTHSQPTGEIEQESHENLEQGTSEKKEKEKKKNKNKNKKNSRENKKQNNDIEKYQYPYEAKHKKKSAVEQPSKRRANTNKDASELDNMLSNAHIDEKFREEQRPNHVNQRVSRERPAQTGRFRVPEIWGEIIDGQLVLVDERGWKLPCASSYVVPDDRDEDAV